MASEIKCEIVSVTFEEGDYTGSYTSCWSQAVPDSGWSSTNVTTGLRKSVQEGAAAWRTCQYFMKGMPAICTSWNGSICTNKDKPIPSGYNDGHCDFLGRRNWCSKYSPSGSDKLDQWICVAPNPYLTGLTERAEGKDSPIVAAIPKSKIKGYNPDSNGAGQCDCYGMGRGAAGCAAVGGLVLGTGSVDVERELEKLPVVCNFYRSWRMGFGAIAPHERRLKDGSPDLEAMLRLVETDAPYEYRMPLSFYVYNCRAAFRKCLWYDKEKGSNFIFHDTFNTIILEEEANGDPFTNDKLNFCVCPDSAALPYNTRVKGDDAPKNLIANIWAKAGTVICNGAKPECPCYSADWIYPVDEKMWAGMPVTAQQVLELRFWSNDWESQKEYDDYFARKPNSTDPRTADIYTFRGWENISSDGDVAQMHGNHVHLKQPCESDNRYFDPALYITGPKVVYAKYGMTTGGQVTFSNLVDLLSGLLGLADDFREFFLAYPYFNDDSFSGSDPNNQQPGYTKPTNEIVSDRIYTVGQTVRSKSVYALNLTVLGSAGMIDAYENTFKLKTEQKELLNAQITNLIQDASENNYEYISKTISGEKAGIFVTDPIKLLPGYNLILICADVGNGQWRFKKRKVKSLWCGGYIIQSKFKHVQNGLNNESFQFQPFSFTPSASVSANVIRDGGSSDVNLYPVRSYTYPGDPTINYYSYSITETEETINSDDKNKLKWFAIGNSYFVWCEITNPDVNSLFHWEFISAKMIYKPVDEKAKGNAKRKAKAYPSEVKMIATELNKDYMAPNAIMLSPEDANTNRIVFSPNEWSLEVKYKYQKLTAGIGSGDVLSGAGANENNKYKSLDISLSGNSIYSDNVNKDTLAVMAIFNFGTNINNTRPIAAVATRLLVYATDVRCRGVDILYRYSADGKEYVLVPNTGFSINPGGDSPVGMATHTSFPFCGDHECGDPCYGPMWFPYNVCTTKDYYQVWAIAASCAQPHDRTPKQPGEYRYMGPEMYKARAEVRDSSGSTCLVPFAYYYSNASAVEPTFTGYANVKGKVDVGWYTTNKWELPPFGNDGRDLIERFVSQEFHYHYDVTKQPPPIISEWVAMAMDQNAFYMGFNAFKDFRPNDPRMDDIDYSNTIKSGLDQFHFTNQMSFLTYSAIENLKDAARYRWEDIFRSDAATPATYPPPIRGEQNPIVDFYIFQDDRFCWAWRELPTPPDRGSNKLNFVNEYKYPPYVFSSLKEEVRLGIDEGKFDVKYIAPKKDPDTGEMGIIASIMGRSFKILYGTPTEVTYRAGTPDEKKIQIYQYSPYDYHEQDYVEWMDEGGSLDGVSPVDSGASSKKDNPYEVCFGSKWIFGQEPELFRNIIFYPPGDSAGGLWFWSDTEENPETGVYSKLFYRRGLIVDITRNRLMYLPKYEFEGDLVIESTGANLTTAKGDIQFTIASFSQVEVTSGFPSNGIILGGGGHTWTSGATQEQEVVLGAAPESNVVVISKIVITGMYGRLYSTKTEDNTSGEYVFLKPGFNMVGNTVDGEEGYIPRGFPSVSSVVPEYPKKPGTSNMMSYSIIINLPISPLEMLKKGYKDFSFTITGGPIDTYINIEKIVVTTVEYKEEASETIDVWERKYIASTSSATLNPDGPNGFLYGTNGGGVHFNFQSKPDEEHLMAENKIRGAHASSKLYYIGKDTPIDIGIGTLFEVEAQKQRDIYNKAIESDIHADTKQYSGQAPPNLTKAITKNKITNAGVFSRSGLIFDCEPLPFLSHPVVSDKFNQYSIWRPGGHKFIWGDAIEHTSCELERLSDGRIINATWEDVVSAKFQHITHGGDQSDEIMSAMDSFYSGRFYYEKARYDNVYGMTGKEPEGGMDLVNGYKMGDYYGH